MAHPGFGHLWKNVEMSDVEIVISSAPASASAGLQASGAHNSTMLQQFPGQSPILSSSPYFAAQVLRWSKPSQPRMNPSRWDSDRPFIKRHAKQQVNITLPDASYEPAAMAVLAGLYQVQSWSKLLADLTPQQQVQAAVLADMWQLPAASEAAVAVLQAVPDIAELSVVLEQLLSMAAMPDCFMPVFEQALLGKYGNLEAVWGPAGASLQASLLGLPLYAMELLLASDRLKIASEDTVLYTAQAYADKLALASHWTAEQLTVIKLAPLVRCPHLSQFWLSASVLSDIADALLLRALQPQLKRLLLLKASRSTGRGLSAEDISKGVPSVPDSWLQPVRNVRPANSAWVEWEPTLADIKQAAHDSASKQETVILAPTAKCLLGGLRWGFSLHCTWDSSKQAIKIGMYVEPEQLPAGSSCRSMFTVSCGTARGNGMLSRQSKPHNFGDVGPNWGWPDFFHVGTMSGGFAEAAWAAKGLPTTGSIKLRLTVKDVGM